MIHLKLLIGAPPEQGRPMLVASCCPPFIRQLLVSVARSGLHGLVSSPGTNLLEGQWGSSSCCRLNSCKFSQKHHSFQSEPVDHNKVPLQRRCSNRFRENICLQLKGCKLATVSWHTPSVHFGLSLSNP